MKSHAIQLGFCPKDESSLKSVLESVDSEVLQVGSRPHISLAVFHESEIDENLYLSVLERCLMRLESFYIKIEKVDSFPGLHNVSFLKVQLGEKLQKAHDLLHLELKKNSLVSHDYYLPGKWTPHITLTMGDKEKKISALNSVSKLDIFRKYRINFLAFIEFRPVKVIGKYDLKT